jgi:hypothetical protein
VSFGVGSECRSARQLFELSERGGVKLKSQFTNDRANDGRRFINPVVHQREGNWSRARRDQPIDRFDEFYALDRSRLTLVALSPCKVACET